jgi:hypothetical protein
MGGGKSRALCEETFDTMLECPGVLIPIFRMTHSSIVNTTRKTFVEQVLPSELRDREDLVKIRSSNSADYVKLWNGSEVHFVGLQDAAHKWFSSELGAARFDEAHEMSESDVLTINTRLRQRCPDCVKKANSKVECHHYPHDLILTFNPSYPGHWLMKWFILGAVRTEFGYRKEELLIEDADDPIGSAEFIVSKVTDNPYVGERYIKQNLGGLDKMKRRRYLEGLWEHIGGSSFFDGEALGDASGAAAHFEPYLPAAEPRGDVTGKNAEDCPRIIHHSSGRMQVFKAPVRRWVEEKSGTEHKAHRYVIGVDSSSGVSADYSAIQVVDVEEHEQVAEWQGKVDPDQLATAAFITACVYNGAQIVPEITGGWGFAVTKRLQQLIADYRPAPRVPRPTLYMRPMTDRLSQKFTDLLGWDTTTKTRAVALAALEEGLRDGSLTVHGQRTLSEMAAFALPARRADGEYGAPRAQKDEHDDLVMALAIAYAVVVRAPTSNASVAPPPPPVGMGLASGW